MLVLCFEYGRKAFNAKLPSHNFKLVISTADIRYPTDEMKRAGEWKRKIWRNETVKRMHNRGDISKKSQDSSRRTRERFSRSNSRKLHLKSTYLDSVQWNHWNVSNHRMFIPRCVPITFQVTQRTDLININNLIFPFLPFSVPPFQILTVGNTDVTIGRTIQAKALCKLN